MVRRAVSRSVLAKEPYALWNAFVDLLAMSKYDDLSELQRVAHLVFWYEHEVQNGGHHQYFENRGTERLDETINSLVRIGAMVQSRLLTEARIRFLSKPRTRSPTVEEFVAGALEREFADLDSTYYECRPSIPELLEHYLHKNMEEFIEL